MHASDDQPYAHARTGPAGDPGRAPLARAAQDAAAGVRGAPATDARGGRSAA
jgi:hypothetical protein